MRSILLMAAVSVAAPQPLQHPVTITCFQEVPDFAAVWGAMPVTVDEQAGHVHIEADKTSPGAKVDYWNGAFASIYTGRIYPWMDEEPVEQFVRFTAKQVEVGWHDLNGEFQHYATFNRSALLGKGIKCRWRVYWPLGQG